MKDASLKQHQLDSFAETARKIGADESDDALDRALGKLDLKRKPEENVVKTKPSAKAQQ